MRALTWHSPGDIRIDEVPEPELIHPDDAIVRVTTAALCGSDLHLFRGKGPTIRPGHILGHEFCGEVVAVGGAVRRVEVGDRVLASMMTACGRCDACMAGEHVLCPDTAIFGYGTTFGDLDGGQAELVRVPFADVALSRIPAALDDEDVIFAGDILATAYTGCVAGRIEHGDIVAVVGAGPVGQLVVECLQLFGPARVFAIDLDQSRLAAAAAAGAVGIDASAGDPVAMMREQTGGARANVVIEAVGNAASLTTAWRLAATNAHLSLVGFLADEPFPVSAGQSWLRGLQVTPVVGKPLAYRARLLRLIEAGRLNPRRIISDYVSLEELPDAYERMERRQVNKVLVKP